MPPANKTAIPADFVETAKRMGISELVKHYNASFSRIYRWLSDTGVTPAKRYSTPPCNKREMPSDFADLAPTMSKAELLRHYGIKWNGTIDRWLEEAGVQARCYVPTQTFRPNPGLRFVPIPARGDSMALIRVKSAYEEAADRLRRKCAVYRCNERGAFDPKGKMWRYGMTVLTGDELLAKAAA